MYFYNFKSIQILVRIFLMSQLFDRSNWRLNAIISQSKLIKNMSPMDRWEGFFNIQNDVWEKYWSGLKSRYPAKDEKELKLIALKETKRKLKHKVI